MVSVLPVMLITCYTVVFVKTSRLYEGCSLDLLERGAVMIHTMPPPASSVVDVEFNFRLVCCCV